MPRLNDMIDSLTRTRLQRLKRVMREGSPRYPFTVSALAASSREEFDINTSYPQAKKYEPLDTMQVINEDTIDIGININGMGSGQYYVIPAGTIFPINPEDCGAIWQIRVTNLSTTAALTAGKIKFFVWRSPETIDSIARGNV